MEKKYCTSRCAGHGKHSFDCPYLGEDMSNPLRGLLIDDKEANKLEEEADFRFSPVIERKILEAANAFATEGSIIPLRHAIRSIINNL